MLVQYVVTLLVVVVWTTIAARIAVASSLDDLRTTLRVTDMREYERKQYSLNGWLNEKR